jgi:hypothetical protein
MRQRIPQSKIKDFCQPPLGKGAIGCGSGIGLRADVGIGPYGEKRSAAKRTVGDADPYNKKTRRFPGGLWFG